MRRVARRWLPTEFGDDLSGRILADADAGYPALAERLPAAGLGAGHLLRIGAYAVALRQALDEVGVDAHRANALISDIVFQTVMPARTALKRLGRLRHRDPMEAANWSSRLARRLYYRSPDWEMHDVPVAGGFGMDVTRCVVAEYFDSLGMSDLCQAAICEQDVRSATHHGLRFERSGTLAGGSDRCDFRYTAGRSARSAPSGGGGS